MEILPFGKRLSAEAIGILWLTFPATAKATLTPAQLQFAVAQRLLDPNPPAEVPIHISLLRYLYRIENNSPNVAWGLKADLPQRMQRPDLFHALSAPPASIELAALPPSDNTPGFLSDYITITS